MKCTDTKKKAGVGFQKFQHRLEIVTAEVVLVSPEKSKPGLIVFLLAMERAWPREMMTSIHYLLSEQVAFPIWASFQVNRAHYTYMSCVLRCTWKERNWHRVDIQYVYVLAFTLYLLNIHNPQISSWENYEYSFIQSSPDQCLGGLLKWPHIPWWMDFWRCECCRKQ